VGSFRLNSVLLAEGSILGSLREVGYVVGPCHHGMARPQVADRGTASFMEGSYEYIE